MTYGYEINVAKNGKHYFATHERSLTGTAEAESALKDFKNRFPESEGFSVTISYRPGTTYGCYLDEGGNLINQYVKNN
jgi:hypothetical protein